MKKEFKTKSKKARECLQRSEGIDTEFKQSLSGLKTSTMVAFANSVSGGTVLVGIEEVTSPDGLQRGSIIGCEVSDNQKLIIQNKAADCTPPIELEIYIENSKYKPFFRIEIPSGRFKPYCTKSGEYKIREDGRDRALHPDELLAIFLVKEGEKFLSDFKNSTKAIEEKVSGLSANLMGDLDYMIDYLKRSNFQMEAMLDESAGSINDAHAEAEEVNRNIDYLARKIHAVEQLLERTTHGTSNYDLDIGIDRVQDKLDRIIEIIE